MTELFVCPWCNNLTPKHHHKQVYCDKRIRDCSKQARKYKVNKNVKNYNSKHIKNVLGSTNINEHSNSDFMREEEIVEKELNRVMKGKRFF